MPRLSSRTSCWVGCEDGGPTCELSATGSASCGYVHLQLPGCAGAGPPCLDTTAVAPYYVDASGKTWSVLSFSGAALTTTGAALLESDLTLTLSDGSVTRELPFSKGRHRGLAQEDRQARCLLAGQRTQCLFSIVRARHAACSSGTPSSAQTRGSVASRQ